LRAFDQETRNVRCRLVAGVIDADRHVRFWVERVAKLRGGCGLVM
jgi:hypothetical protein